MRDLIVVLRGLLMLANILCGLIGLVWLAICGEWNLIFACVVLLWFSNWIIIHVLLAVSTPLTMMMLRRVENGEVKITSPIRFIEGLLTTLAMGVWSCGTLYIVTFFMSGPSVAIPSALLAFAVATGPFLHLATRNDAAFSGCGSSSVLSVLNEFVFIAIAIALLTVGLSFKSICISYAIGCLVITVIGRLIADSLLDKAIAHYAMNDPHISAITDYLERHGNEP